jgi:RNA polymerase sigma-70 factor (ECF subfamily)
MVETPPSLLKRLRTEPEAAAWRRLVELYTPLLHTWMGRYALQAHDADDLVQEVLSAVARELPTFEYDPERGRFRTWLRSILANRLRAFWRGRQAQPQAAGGSKMAEQLDQLADPASALSQQWDQEHDRHVVHRALAAIRGDFELATRRAFERTTLDGVKAAAVAGELGLSVNAVWSARSRVMRRLRREIQGLVG